MSTFGVYVALCLPRRTIAILRSEATERLARRIDHVPLALGLAGFFGEPGALLRHRHHRQGLREESGSSTRLRNRLSRRRVGVATDECVQCQPARGTTVRCASGSFSKPDKTEAGVLLEELVPWLRERGPRARSIPTEDQIAPAGARDRPGGRARAPSSISRSCSAATARCCAPPGWSPIRASPVLGINLGQLGFLAMFAPAEAQGALAAALAGKLPRAERMRLHGDVHARAAPSRSCATRSTTRSSTRARWRG